MIETQQPVGLVKAVFAHQWRLFQHGQARVVGVDTDVARVVDAPHGGLMIEGRRHGQDVAVGLFRGTHNHLRRLPGGNEPWRMAKLAAVLLVLKHSLLDEHHRLEHTLVILLGSQQLQRLLTRYFDVHTHAVGPPSGFGQQLARRTWDALQVNVAVEAVHCAQIPHNSGQPFHGVVGVAHHTTRQEQPLYVVPSVELHRDFLQFADRKRRPRNVVRTAVDAVGAVILAVVGQHHLEQRDTSPVVGKGMADANAANGVSNHAFLALAHGATRRARNVVLRRFCEYPQPLHCLFCQHKLLQR